MGTGDREVARLLEMSPNTERAYRKALATAGLLGGEGFTPGFVARGFVDCAARPFVTCARFPFAPFAPAFAPLAADFAAGAGAEYGVEAATAFAPNTAMTALLPVS